MYSTPCKLIFNHKESLREHIERYHMRRESFEVARIKCKHCKGSFINEEDLKLHFRRHHDIPFSPSKHSNSNNVFDGRSFCSVCNTRFHNNDLLISHVKRVHEARINEIKRRSNIKDQRGRNLDKDDSYTYFNFSQKPKSRPVYGASWPDNSPAAWGWQPVPPQLAQPLFNSGNLMGAVWPAQISRY